MADSHLAVWSNTVAFGMIEVGGEIKVLLDELVLEMSEVEKKLCADREERTALDGRIYATGGDMRSCSLSRKGSSAGSADDEENGVDRKARKRQAVVVDSDEDTKDVIEENIKSPRVLDAQSIPLKEERIAFEKLMAGKKSECPLRQRTNDVERLS